MVRWYRLAAEQGHASAQSNLGVMYANGEGVPEGRSICVRLAQHCCSTRQHERQRGQRVRRETHDSGSNHRGTETVPKVLDTLRRPFPVAPRNTNPARPKHSSTCSASLPSSRPTLRQERQAEGIARSQATRCLSRPPAQDRHAGHQASSVHGPVRGFRLGVCRGFVYNRGRPCFWNRSPIASRSMSSADRSSSSAIIRSCRWMAGVHPHRQAFQSAAARRTVWVGFRNRSGSSVLGLLWCECIVKRGFCRHGLGSGE